MPEIIVYIISQICITGALLIQGRTYFVSSRHRQLMMIIISNTLSAICFLLLGGYVAVAMNFIAIARDVTCYRIGVLRMQNRLPESRQVDLALLGLWIVLLSVGSLVTANGFLSMLPYFSTMIFTVAIWQKNMLVYRFAGLITNSLLIAYNVFLFNVMGVFLQSGLLMMAICGFVLYFIKPTQRDVSRCSCDDIL